ncbi:2OG-Fe(II) oxygenase [Novosphingobium sp. 1Y9A]|uniref:2OG-Fe(II) oxygenase n=1 Tax=Novosphingobium jiangmenense TaxID=2791981 RepID=A0ABS0HDJ1_9SPHN|nr:2OG-Fe(II) oxygenase [Novosphingobium jiangmenense]MBF9150348.1 2OG-Fe(II) oxygenase [Novosphingobium jiangmenense]
MSFFAKRKSETSETLALRKVGETVRLRLSGDGGVYRIPVEGLEIFGVADFFSTAECDKLMAIVDSVARPSPTYKGTDATGRTSYTGDVDPFDPFILMLQRRIDDLMGIDPALGETIQGQRYEPGQEFRAHYDHFLPSQHFWDTEQKRGGQRSWTAMAYLNAVEEGGTTDFPRVNLSIPPQPGALLIWNNMKPDGTPNPDALHAGTPVVRGTKYVLTKWYRARPWH